MGCITRCLSNEKHGREALNISSRPDKINLGLLKYNTKKIKHTKQMFKR